MKRRKKKLKKRKKDIEDLCFLMEEALEDRPLTGMTKSQAIRYFHKRLHGLREKLEELGSDYTHVDTKIDKLERKVRNYFDELDEEQEDDANVSYV